MPDKKQSPLKEGEELAAVDAELEAAMQHLSTTNERVDEMLSRIESGIDDELEVEEEPIVEESVESAQDDESESASPEAEEDSTPTTDAS